MLTEGQTSKQVGEIAVAVIKGPAPVLDSIGRRMVGLTPFLAIVAQFGLIVLIVDYWQLEGLSVSRVMQLAFVGFVIHHWLAFRLRLPFFAAPSIVSVLAGVGHFGPNIIGGWLSGKSTAGSLLYHLVPGSRSGSSSLWPTASLT